MIQSSIYSHYKYKHNVTYKGLVRIALSGAVTFISELYIWSISDQKIVKRSGFPAVLDGDSVMADCGFTIEEDLKPFGVS